MLEKIGNFFNAEKQLEQPVQPEAVKNSPVRPNIKVLDNQEEQKQNKTMLQDEKILKCCVLYAEAIAYSTSVKGPCIYIHTKPGRDIYEISNADFVQYIYAEYGINLKKHISHLDHKEKEVLYLSAKSYCALDEPTRNFFDRTAPIIKDIHDYRDSDVYDRANYLLDKIIKEQGSR